MPDKKSNIPKINVVKGSGHYQAPRMSKEEFLKKSYSERVKYKKLHPQNYKRIFED